jgi:LacI family transcriptional regulator
MLVIDPRDRQGRPRLPDGWRGDGIIVRLSSRAQAEQIRTAGLPVVNLERILPEKLPMEHVYADEDGRAGLAFEHLRDRGFQRYAYFAPPSMRYSNVRGEKFLTAVKEAGYTCAVYRPGYRAGRQVGWSEHLESTSRWLESLEKPVAVFTADAASGRLLAEVCQWTGVRVPDEVAILAGTPDELICGISSPPLSSINLASQHTGYAAAALLDRLMSGIEPGGDPILIRPLGVICRQSTDVLAIDDPNIVMAVRFIRAHAHQGIHVDDVLREVPVSRRALEIQFQEILGRSPAQEIRRVRLEKAKDLLANSEMSVAKIASVSGFLSAARLSIAFRKHFGTTPLAYRKEARNW